MDLGKIKMQDILNMKSERHHYIPKFLAAGFTDNEGKFYLYDKVKDKIINNKQAPKGIFFEKKRNTVQLKNGEESALLEEIFFKDIDDTTSKRIKYLQTESIEKLELNQERRAMFIYFLTDLFWRIPFTDTTAKDLINKDTIKWGDIDPEILKNDPSFQKLHRSGLGLHTLFEVMAKENKEKEYWNVVQMGEGEFVLGDNPILYKELPETFTDIRNNDFLFAISSNRIVYKTSESLKNFNAYNMFDFNVSIISQSIRYVVCKNLKLLEESIKLYKHFKEIGVLNHLNKKAFRTQ